MLEMIIGGIIGVAVLSGGLYIYKYLNRVQKLGYFITEEWSNEAIEDGVGYDHLKKLRHYVNGVIVKEEQFSIPKLNLIKRAKIPFKNLTEGQTIPKDSEHIPAHKQIFGLLQLNKRI